MYIDAMIAPVKTAQKSEYTRMSRHMSAMFKQHGALSYVECWGEDVPPGEHTSFPRAVDLAEDETCAIGFITYPDKATRDACMAAVMSDESTQKAMQDAPLDGRRMIFGGFETLVSV